MKKIIFVMTFIFAGILFAAPESYTPEAYKRETIHLNLEDAVSYALKNSYTVRTAAVDLESKEDTVNHILNSLFPTIQTSGTINRASQSENWNVMGNLSFGLNYNGSLITDIRKAREDYQAGQISFDQTKRKVERDTKKLFYALLLNQKNHENNLLSLENTRQRAELAEQSFNNGYITRQDFLQTQVSYQNMKRDIEKEEAAFNQQIDQFAMLLGMPVGSKVVLEGDLNSKIIDFDEYELLKKYGPTNSEYVLSGIKLDSINQQIAGLQLKSFTPTFSMNYSLKPTLYDFNSNWFNSSNWTDTGNLNFTISWDLSGLFPWSNNRIQYRSLQREKAKLEISREEITSQLWTEIKKTLDDISSAKKAIEASEGLIDQAEQAYNLTNESYRNGRADFLTVKESETQLNKTRLTYQSDLYTYISGIIDLEYLLSLPENWAEQQ